jgi:hypothetical protein
MSGACRAAFRAAGFGGWGGPSGPAAERLASGARIRRARTSAAEATLEIDREAGTRAGRGRREGETTREGDGPSAVLPADPADRAASRSEEPGSKVPGGQAAPPPCSPQIRRIAPRAGATSRARRSLGDRRTVRRAPRRSSGSRREPDRGAGLEGPWGQAAPLLLSS